jgi:NAD(P)-dependent dehydrogenase (short-subunit alcohol dehydrogenase family)
MPVTATPWRMVPSTPARNAYLASKSLVAWAARAASWAWWTSQGCTVSCLRPDAEVVHWARTGQGPQVRFAKVITIVSVPRWATGFLEAYRKLSLKK